MMFIKSINKGCLKKIFEHITHNFMIYSPYYSHIWNPIHSKANLSTECSFILRIQCSWMAYTESCWYWSFQVGIWAVNFITAITFTGNTLSQGTQWWVVLTQYWQGILIDFETLLSSVNTVYVIVPVSLYGTVTKKTVW